MNMRNGILILVLSVLAVSCTKKDVGAVSFDVTTSSTTYNVGDSVVFNFSGNPDYIVYYSGENGHQYQYRNRTKAQGTPYLNFLTYLQFGTHPNTLRLLLSTDFSGSYDTVGIRNATWTDITSKAILSTGKDSTFSGNISLAEYNHPDTPIYVAFKFADKQDGVVSQRTWTIRNLSLINKLQDSSSSTLLDIPNSIWLGVNFLNPAVLWTISNASLRISGGNLTAPSNEDWVISQPVNLGEVNPDTGVAIKTLTAPVLKSYYHIYTKPGNYTVVFDAVNANSTSRTEGQKTINITIQ